MSNNNKKQFKELIQQYRDITLGDIINKAEGNKGEGEDNN